jgi:hypothetical protein
MYFVVGIILYNLCAPKNVLEKILTGTHRFLTNTREQGSSPETYIYIFFFDSSEISLILWDLSVHYRAHNSPPFVPILESDQINPRRLLKFSEAPF